MRKRSSLIIALLLAVAMLLSACAKTENTTEANTTDTKPEVVEGGLAGSITVQAESGWMEYYEAAAKRVMDANPDVTIELKEIGAFDHLDLIDKTDALNEDVADLFALPADRLYGLAETEVLAAIDSTTIAGELGGWADFDAGIGGNFKIGEEYLAFPYNIETLIDFVNTANAEANSVDVSMPFEMADQTAATPILLPFFDAWYGVSVANAAGIELLGKDSEGKLYSDMTVEWADLSDEKKAAFETIYKYWKLNYDEGTSLFDPEAGWGYIDDAFTTGKAGVIRLGGPWDTNSILEQAGEENLAIRPISHITLNGKPLVHWQGGWGLGINSRIEEDANKYAIAVAMIKEIVNPNYAVDLFKATGKILENVPADVYAVSDISDIEKAVISAVMESYEIAPARPLFKEWGNVWDTWKNGVLSWNSVQPADAESAYAELKASFDAMMMNFQ